MHPLRQQVAALLEELGGSVTAIAANLKANGVQGVRHAVRFLNPVVRYVQGKLLTSNAGMDVIDLGVFRVNLLDGKKVEVPLPQAVEEFLYAFNDGIFPELERPIEAHAGELQRD